MSGEDSDTRFVVALDEARRGFDDLAAEVATIKDRAISTLGMGGLAASLFGGLAVRDGADVDPWLWTAALAFAFLAVFVTFVLWPRRFHVSMNPATLVSWAEDYGTSLTQIQRNLALHLGDKYVENRRVVDRLGALHICASCLFLVEVIALLLHLMPG